MTMITVGDSKCIGALATSITAGAAGAAPQDISAARSCLGDTLRGHSQGDLEIYFRLRLDLILRLINLRLSDLTDVLEITACIKFTFMHAQGAKC